jgi:hypothetical protein
MRSARLTAMFGALVCAQACTRAQEIVSPEESASAAPADPPASAPASEPTVALDQPQPQEDDEAPAVTAYPPVQIENIVVRRSGQHVELVTKVSRVSGARRYDYQVARTLLFEPLVVERSAPAAMVKLGPMSPGMYFVHVRAAGGAGEGPFGDVRVVHAEKSGVAKLETIADEPAIAGLPPEEHAVTPIVAAETKRAPDLDRLGPLRQRFEGLRRDLAEVEALRREVQVKVADLQARLAGGDAKSAAALKAELDGLESTRVELDREIAAGLAELDRMRAASAP